MAASGRLGRLGHRRQVSAYPSHYGRGGTQLRLVCGDNYRYCDSPHAGTDVFRYLWDRKVWVQIAGFLAGSAAAAYLWTSARSTIFYGWIEPHKDTDAWLEKMGAAAEFMQEFYYAQSFVEYVKAMGTVEKLPAHEYSTQAFFDEKGMKQ